MSLGILAAVALQIPSVPLPEDQTADASLVLRFLNAARAEDYSRAGSMLAEQAFLGDLPGRNRGSVQEFVDYTRNCRLRRITLVMAVTRYRNPIGVEWLCVGANPDRYASFWFEGNRIRRIGWGTPPIISVPR